MSDGAPNAPTAPVSPERSVHRLVDMLVEEVSLVDRPANKQRFLVVKRESDMSKRTEEKAPAEGNESTEPKGKKPKAPLPKEKAKKPVPPAPAKGSADEDEEHDEDAEEPGKAKKAFPPKKKDPDEEQSEDQEDEPEDEPADEGKPARKAPKGRARKDAPADDAEPRPGAPDDEANDDDETPLGIALAALDSLTQAVEILSDSPDDGSQLASVADDIRAAADAISTAAGIEAEEEGEEQSGEASSIGSLVSSIQEMLSRIESLTQALSASAKTPEMAPTTTSTETQAPPDLAGTLAEVAQSMKSLDVTVKAQSARLEALEKRAGVPNSQPAGERVTKREPPDDLSWPMDMNRPRDRASVSKDVSFHGAVE